MNIFGILMTFFLTHVFAVKQNREDMPNFRMPTLSAASRPYENSSSNSNPDYVLDMDESLNINDSIKNQLINIDKQIKMSKQTKKMQIDRAYHYQQKAYVYYHAHQIDQYKTYMQLSLDTELKIIQIQEHIEELELKRNNLLHRIQLELSENKSSK